MQLRGLFNIEHPPRFLAGRPDDCRFARAPLKMLVEACDAARAQRRAGNGGMLTISISDGVYYLSDTLGATPIRRR